MTPEQHCAGCRCARTWHGLTPGIVQGLIKFRRAWLAAGRPHSLHNRKDLDGTPYELTKTEYGNWTCLRFHGLIAKDKDAGRGYWIITRRGHAFLKGLESIPNRVQTRNNEVMHDHGETLVYVTVEDVMQTWPPFERIEDFERVPEPGTATSKQLGLFA